MRRKCRKMESASAEIKSAIEGLRLSSEQMDKVKNLKIGNWYRIIPHAYGVHHHVGKFIGFDFNPSGEPIMNFGVPFLQSHRADNDCRFYHFYSAEGFTSSGGTYRTYPLTRRVSVINLIKPYEGPALDSLLRSRLPPYVLCGGGRRRKTRRSKRAKRASRKN